MRNTYQHLIIIVGIVLWICLQQSCTHDPLFMEEIDPEPMDSTINPMDTTIMDTTILENPCDADLVYFDRDILPILLGSCAFSGCHDVTTASDGVVLNNYDNVIKTGEVVPNDLSESELYEAITENDADKIMPPSGKIENEKISLIAKWILQGAKDLHCDEASSGCLTENVSYSGVVKDVFSTSCNGCHSSSTAFGNIILDTYTGVKTVVDAGRLYGAINWSQGFSKMPQGQDQIDSCKIANVKTWIDEGAKNN